MKSKQTFYKSTNWAMVFVLPAVCLFTTGCSNTSDGRKAKAQGAGIGEIAGGALGYVLGGVRGAAMGAGIGGGVGLAYGMSVAKRKVKYAEAEKWLEEEILIAKDAKTKSDEYNRSLESQVAELEQKVSEARAAGDKRALNSLRGEISRLLRESRSVEEEQEKAVADLKEVSADPQAQAAKNFRSLEVDADALKGATAESGRLTSRLATLQSSIAR